MFEHNTLLLTDKDDTRSISKWLHMIMNPEDVIFFRSLSCGPENQVMVYECSPGLHKGDQVSVQ